LKKRKNKFEDLEGLENAEIGEPENVHKGVQIEVDKQKGQLVNVPETMKEILGEKAQYIKTDNIQSHLNVDIKASKKK